MKEKPEIPKEEYEEYKRTLDEVERLMDADPEIDSFLGMKLDALVTLIMEIENKWYPEMYTPVVNKTHLLHEEMEQK